MIWGRIIISLIIYIWTQNLWSTGIKAYSVESSYKKNSPETSEPTHSKTSTDRSYNVPTPMPPKWDSTSPDTNAMWATMPLKSSTISRRNRLPSSKIGTSSNPSSTNYKKIVRKTQPSITSWRKNCWEQSKIRSIFNFSSTRKSAGRRKKSRNGRTNFLRARLS